MQYFLQEVPGGYAQNLILVNLILVNFFVFFGHSSESSEAFLTKLGGNSSYRPPGAFLTLQGPPRAQKIQVFWGQNVQNNSKKLTTIIVINIQIECEIDIRTLTSHQVFGQILGQIFDQILARFLGSENTVYSSTGTENTVYSSTGTEKGYTLTTIVFSGPTKKTGYPLSTNDIAIC